MKKLLFVFMSVLTFSTFSCSNGNTTKSTVNDSTVVDTDSVVTDSIDTLTAAQYDSIMVNN